MPHRISEYKNAGNMVLVERMLEKYVEENCHVALPLCDGEGRHLFLELFRAVDSSCPDSIHAVKDTKLKDKSIFSKFVFSETKLFDNDTDTKFDVTMHSEQFPHLSAKAAAIRGAGKRYVLYGKGRVMFIPNDTMDKFKEVVAVFTAIDVCESASVDVIRS